MSGINRNGGRSASGCRSAGEDVLTRDARFPATRMSAAPACPHARKCRMPRIIPGARPAPLSAA